MKKYEQALKQANELREERGLTSPWRDEGFTPLSGASEELEALTAMYTAELEKSTPVATLDEIEWARLRRDDWSMPTTSDEISMRITDRKAMIRQKAERMAWNDLFGDVVPVGNSVDMAHRLRRLEFAM